MNTAPELLGVGAVLFRTGEQIVAGWYRHHHDEGGCSAWVFWDNVIYLVTRHCSDPQAATDHIANWIGTVTTPENFEHLPNVLAAPWFERRTPPTSTTPRGFA